MTDLLSFDHPINNLKSFSLDMADHGLLKSTLYLLNICPAYSNFGFIENDTDEFEVLKNNFIKTMHYFHEHKVKMLIFNERNNKKITLAEYINELDKTKDNNDLFEKFLYIYTFSFPFKGNEWFVEEIKSDILKSLDIDEDLLQVKLVRHHEQICISGFSILITYLKSSYDKRNIVNKYLDEKNKKLREEAKKENEFYVAKLELQENTDNLLFFKFTFYKSKHRRDYNRIPTNDQFQEYLTNFINEHVINDIKLCRRKKMHLTKFDGKMVFDTFTFMSGYSKNINLFNAYEDEI